MAWIVDHPGELIRLTALRFVHSRCGSLHRPEHVAWTTLLTLLALLGMRHSLPEMTVPQRAGLLIPLVTFPLIYYVVFCMSRDRVPLNWVLLISPGRRCGTGSSDCRGHATRRARKRQAVEQLRGGVG